MTSEPQCSAAAAPALCESRPLYSADDCNALGLEAKRLRQRGKTCGPFQLILENRCIRDKLPCAA